MSNVSYDMYGQIIILNSVILLLDLIYFERFDVTTYVGYNYSKRTLRSWRNAAGSNPTCLLLIKPVSV